MQYCIEYNKELSAFAQQLKIKYDSKKSKMLPSFLEQHPDQMIIIESELKEENFELFSALAKKYSNFKVLIGFTPSLKNMKLDFPYFFDVRIGDWDLLNSLISCFSPTDVYIGGQLCYQLKEVSRKLHKKNIKVRIIPNMAQHFSFVQEPNEINSFFVRPEDIHVYEDYVDVCDLLYCSPVIYRVYAEDKKWWGPLKEIIIGLDSDIDNRYVGPEFALFRLSCGKKCSINKKSCSMCKKVEDLSKVIAASKEKN